MDLTIAPKVVFERPKREVPLGVIGLICLRSTWARLGLLAPLTVADPGFRGTLTMEMFNGSIFGIRIEPGMKMWSISYLKLGVDEPLYQGRYQGQTELQLPKALKQQVESK